MHKTVELGGIIRRLALITMWAQRTAYYKLGESIPWLIIECTPLFDPRIG